MARPALGALLFLLLASRGVSTDPEGELCPAAPGAAGDAFRCPQSLDGADAKFCCGTCSLPYCCPAGEAELEGQRCPRSALLETQPTQGPPSTRGPPATRGPPTTRGPPATIQPPTDKPLERWAALLAFGALLLAVALWNSVCYCRKRYWGRPRPIRYGSLFNIHMPIWRMTRGRFIPPPPLGDPPPYTEDPPPYSPEEEPAESEDGIERPPSPVVIFHRAFSGSSEDDVTIGPLVHRNVPSSSSSEAPPLEEEIAAD